jgi:hypothetical protein
MDGHLSFEIEGDSFAPFHVTHVRHRLESFAEGGAGESLGSFQRNPPPTSNLPPSPLTSNTTNNATLIQPFNLHICNQIYDSLTVQHAIQVQGRAPLREASC